MVGRRREPTFSEKLVHFVKDKVPAYQKEKGKHKLRLRKQKQRDEMSKGKSICFEDAYDHMRKRPPSAHAQASHARSLRVAARLLRELPPSARPTR